MGIAVDGETGLAAEQLINGHIGTFTFYVPKGLVEPAECVVEDGSVAPVGAHEEGLPEVFYVVYVFADAEIGHIVVDGGHDDFGALGESGAAQAIETGLGGLYFHDDQVGALGCGADGFYGADGYRWEPPKNHFMIFGGG